MSVKFVRKIRQSGNSSPEITIPKPLLDAANLSVGERVVITIDKDKIVIIKSETMEAGERESGY